MIKSLRTPQYEAFRRHLVDARAAAGLTQAEVAARMARPQSFVAKCEAGERRLDVIEFMNLCRALGIRAEVVIAKLEREQGI
jgi:ribosome-binding protein aMBF1 (putative translation factor)